MARPRAHPDPAPTPEPTARWRAADFARSAAGTSRPGPAAPVRVPRPGGVRPVSYTHLRAHET
ncbi:hypothetical protein E1J17_07880, partial [Kocuria rosea]